MGDAAQNYAGIDPDGSVPPCDNCGSTKGYEEIHGAWRCVVCRDTMPAHQAEAKPQNPYICCVCHSTSEQHCDDCRDLCTLAKPIESDTFKAPVGEELREGVHSILAAMQVSPSAGSSTTPAVEASWFNYYELRFLQLFTAHIQAAEARGFQKGVASHEGAVSNIVQTAVAESSKVTGETSDGYHTFNELYDFRKVYNALLFNEWAHQRKFNVYKSKLHSDGELPFGGGWFVVGAQLPSGQITNHYELKDWGLFTVPEVPRASAWDGHTPQQALERMLQQLKQEVQK